MLAVHYRLNVTGHQQRTVQMTTKNISVRLTEYSTSCLLICALEVFLLTYLVLTY